MDASANAVTTPNPGCKSRANSLATFCATLTANSALQKDVQYLPKCKCKVCLKFLLLFHLTPTLSHLFVGQLHKEIREIIHPEPCRSYISPLGLPAHQGQASRFFSCKTGQQKVLHHVLVLCCLLSAPRALLHTCKAPIFVSEALRILAQHTLPATSAGLWGAPPLPTLVHHPKTAACCQDRARGGSHTKSLLHPP